MLSNENVSSLMDIAGVKNFFKLVYLYFSKLLIKISKEIPLIIFRRLLEINQDIWSASSTRHSQFLSTLSRGRGGTCTRSEPSIWDLRAVGCRFRVARFRAAVVTTVRGIKRRWIAGFREMRERACVFFRTVEFIGAPKSSGIVKYLCGLDDCARTSRQSDRSFFTFSILFT